jgi:predicted Zn-dependent protease
MFHRKVSRRVCILVALFWAAGVAVPLIFQAGGGIALLPGEIPPDSGYLVHLARRPLPSAIPHPASARSGLAKSLGANLPRFIPESIVSARWAFSLWLGEKIDVEEEKTHGFHNDPALKQKLHRIISRLKQVSLRPGDPVQFRILNTSDPEVIAEASSSTIYFGKAYLNLPPSEDELMFVAAHEIAHVEMNHTFSKAANVTGVRIQELLHSIQNRIASSLLNLDAQAPGESFRKTQNKIDRGRYSQAREHEADLWGARIALAAGASPQGIKDTLDRFQASRERFNYMYQSRTPTDDTLDTRTLTHPLPLTRLEYLEQALGPKFWDK